EVDGGLTRRSTGQATMQQQDFADLLFDRVQRVERGHRLLEDDADVVAAHTAHPPLIERQQVGAFEIDRAGRMPRGGIRQQFENGQGRDRLARTRFTDQRQRLTLADLERDSVDRLRFPAAGPKGDRKIADAKQGFCHGRMFMQSLHAKVLRGSKASRTASPMKISSESISATVKKPVSPSHGACTLALPWDRSSPSDGEPGGRPKPRKSSAVSVMTDDDMMKGRNVMVATIAFGKR